MEGDDLSMEYEEKTSAVGKRKSPSFKHRPLPLISSVKTTENHKATNQTR